MKASSRILRDWCRSYFIAVEAAALGLALSVLALELAGRMDNFDWLKFQPFLSQNIYSYGGPVFLALLFLSSISAWIWRRDLALAATIASVVTSIIMIIAPNFVHL